MMQAGNGFDLLLEAAGAMGHDGMPPESAVDLIAFLESENQRLTEELELLTRRHMLHREPQPETPHAPNQDLAGAIGALADILERKGEGLPKKEPTIFTGDVFDYPVWKASFEVLVIERYQKTADRIYYLRKYTGGEARKAIEGHLALNTEAAYHQSWTILNERYGDRIRLARSFSQRLEKWPRVTDAKSMQSFVDFIVQYEATMETLVGLKAFDDPVSQEPIIEKLTRETKRAWAKRVDNYRYGNGVSSPRDSYPGFRDLCEFLRRQSRIWNNPVLENPRDIKQSANHKPSAAGASVSSHRIQASTNSETAASTSSTKTAGYSYS